MDLTNIARWILLMTLSVLLITQTQTRLMTQAQQQTPCMFLFGDSQFDNGNNNRLLTLAKCNYSPYGIDYPDGPTGRFCNGRNIADFLAELLGFADPISPFVNATAPDIVRGVNYASGAAGILDESGILQGQRYPMNQQLINHRIIINARITRLLRFNRTAINEYFNKCLYVVNIGSNDYLNNYYILPQPGTSLSSQLYTPDRFAQRLIQQFSQQLTILYRSGARKVAVFGIGLLGCVPQVLANYPTNGSPCVDFINNAVQLFNNRLPPLIISLNSNLAGAQFTFINITNIALGDPSLIGIRVVNASCCPALAINGLCDPNGVPCNNRDEHVFWDNFHPTEIVNRATASRSYNALLPADAFPVDIQRLVQQ